MTSFSKILLALCIMVIATIPHAYAMDDAEIPFYKDAKKGTIQVNAEGETRLFDRDGWVPVGKREGYLPRLQEKEAQKYTQFICTHLDNINDVYFRLDAWPEVPGKNCEITAVQGYVVEKGLFKNTVLLQITWKKQDIELKAVALVEQDANAQPKTILKIIGGVQTVSDMSVEPTLHFVTPKQVVLWFNGYVSEWQSVLSKDHEGKITLEEAQ